MPETGFPVGDFGTGNRLPGQVIENGKIGVLGSRSPRQADGDIRSRDIFLGDVFVEGIPEKGGDVFLSFGGNDRLVGVGLPVYFGSPVHIRLYNFKRLVFAVKDCCPVMPPVPVGEVWDEINDRRDADNPVCE